MTQSSIPREQYSFPNISFTESVVGPLPFTPSWRNNIGVAGVFSRGPIGPTFIRNRQDFAYLYAEDDSPGSLFVRQAMLQGATNFYISRVMPKATKSSGEIYLQAASNATTTEALVGSSPRTIGLNLEFSYIGSPIIPIGQYTGTEVNVAPDQTVFTTFNGTGYFDFKVIEKAVNSGVTPSSEITVEIANTTFQSANNQQNNLGTAAIQVIKASGAAGTTLRNSAKPGRVIKSETATFVSTGGNYLKVLSYPYEESTGVYAVLVEGSVSGVFSGTNDITVDVPSTSDPAYFILAVSYRSVDGSVLPETTVPSRTYYTAGTAVTFFTVPVSLKSYQNLYLFNLASSVYTKVDTGVDVSFGTSTSSPTFELIVGSSFSVPIIRSKVTVGEQDSDSPSSALAFTTGKSAYSILSELLTSVRLDSNISALINADLDDSALPPKVLFESTFVGKEANRVFYKLSRVVTSGSPTDLNFNNYGNYVQLLGGKDEMKYAGTYLYDKSGNPLVYIESVSPGKIGNNITVTVRPQSVGTFKLEVSDNSNTLLNINFKPESFLLSNYSVDPRTGLYIDTTDSKLIRAYFVPVLKANGQAVSDSVYKLVPQRVAPSLVSLATSTDVSNPLHPAHTGSSYLTNIYLTGGSEPVDYTQTNPEDQDYIEAIRRLENVDCSFISVAGIVVADSRYESAVTELVLQAERSSTINGLRIAILPAPPRLSPSRASSLITGISSNRVVVVAGHTTMSGARYLGVNATQPIGFYAGLLASIPPYVSPASVSSGQAVNGVLSVDADGTPEYLDALTRSRLEVLYYDPGLRLFKFLNGITTSSNEQEKYVSVRRITDQIITDLYRNLLWVKSSPNTKSMRSRVATACDAYLKNLVREESIYSFTPTICDESNNTIQDISRGYLNIRLSYTPIYPADYIKVNLVRDLTTEFSINTGTSA